MNTTKKQNNFIKKALKVHKGEKLDYSQCVYIDSKTPVKIIDHDLRPDGTEYGEFWQAPNNHLKGHGHPDKRSQKISMSKRDNQETIIKRFKLAHPDENLDYSQVKYVNMHTKVKIVSHDLRPDGTEYGEFWQEPAVHLKGCTHPDKKTRGRKPDVPNKVSSGVLKQIRNELYQYINQLTNGSVINDRCSDNEPVCIVERQRFAFVCHGLSLNSKYEYCTLSKEFKEKGITLIHVFEDEYLQHKVLVLDKISNILGLNTNKKRVFARNCEIRNITAEKEAVKQFIDKYHIQGYAACGVAYGAFLKDELVGIMTFTNEAGVWNLNRFCTKIDYLCPGVASRLFSCFVKDYRPSLVKSFLDRRWCFNDGENLYTKLGFVLDRVLRPEYRYTNGHGERQHKFGFRKQILHRKYGLPLSMTETQMTESLGYYKIWDCGLFKYVWREGIN